jgi:hypothetical protein
MIRNNTEEILSRINGGLDIGMAGALKKYLYPYDEYNTLNDKLDEIIENPEALGFDHEMLIYPSENKTDEVYPYFLCICREETRLSTALSQMKKVSDKMVKEYGNQSSMQKDVILVTDKWDEETFRKYKLDFLNKAKEYNIWFVILLICGEELQQVPFLPNEDRKNADALTELEYMELIQNKRKEILYPLDGFMFEVSPGTWNMNGRYTYWFNPETLRWHKESVAGGCKDGRIPKRSLEKFMRNVQKLMTEKAGKLIPENNSCDDPRYVLNLFEKVIQWAYTDTENNPEFKRLQRIVDEFIQKCDKEYLKG